jgi:hypothetical protein
VASPPPHVTQHRRYVFLQGIGEGAERTHEPRGLPGLRDTDFTQQSKEDEQPGSQGHATSRSDVEPTLRLSAPWPLTIQCGRRVADFIDYNRRKQGIHYCSNADQDPLCQPVRRPGQGGDRSMAEENPSIEHRGYRLCRRERGASSFPLRKRVQPHYILSAFVGLGLDSSLARLSSTGNYPIWRLLRPMISPPAAVPVPTASLSSSFVAPRKVAEISSVKVRPNYRAKVTDMFSGPGAPSKRPDRFVSDEPRPRILSRQPYLDDDIDRQFERRLKRHGLDREVCHSILILETLAESYFR